MPRSCRQPGPYIRGDGEVIRPDGRSGGRIGRLALSGNQLGGGARRVVAALDPGAPRPASVAVPISGSIERRNPDYNNGNQDYGCVRQAIRRPIRKLRPKTSLRSFVNGTLALSARQGTSDRPQ
jgi:hypothetical protein